MTELAILHEEITEQTVDCLAPYIAKARQVTLASDADAPFYLKELVEGILLSGQLLSQAYFQLSKAKTLRKRAEAIAYLEKYPKYTKEKELKKGTVAEIEHFVNLDEEVKKAQDQIDYFDALTNYISSVRQSLVLSHDDLKKTTYTRSYEMMMSKSPHLGG